MTQEKKTVYECISAVMADISKQGISKDRKNQQQGYSFRGIDDIYNALSAIMSEHKLVILPRVLSRQITEKTTKTGGALFYTVLDCEFDFISAYDGSKHVVRTLGEAMDSADKSTNKAMSAAYKYACMQAFCIPTEGDNDADAQTHEVVSEKPKVKKPDPELEKIKETCAKIKKQILDAKTVEAVNYVWTGFQPELAAVKLKAPKWYDSLESEYKKRQSFLAYIPTENDEDTIPY